MNRRETAIALLALGAAGVPFVVLAQNKDKLWRVGVVFGGSALTVKPFEDAFLAGMKDHGYEVGRNLILDARYAEADPTRYPALVDEVIDLRPDVLVGANTGVARTMKSKTTTIPIVLSTSADPVGDGLVQSLARPGGNVTGNSSQVVELSAKQIELMADLLPRMRRVALLLDMSDSKSQVEQYERFATAAAAAKGLTLEVHRVDNLHEIPQVFGLLETHRAQALVLAPSPRLNALRREISESAMKLRLPSISFIDDYPRDGGLMSYGPSWVEAYRRVAYFVDRIFKGVKPADMPIEQPTRFELVINLKTAKALGLTIPQSMLLRADRVIG